MDESGVWRTEKQHIGGIAEKYFKRIFTTSRLTNVDEVLDSVDIVVMEGMNRDLQRPFIGEEVRKACF